jgi:MoaA/NifB/PqqE/SkfB family radical SAM enzyme
MREDILGTLQERFGAVNEDIKKRFGNKFVNGLQGWQFSPDEIRKANESRRLLTIDLDFPGERCALDCIYCFAKAGEKIGTYYRPDKGTSPLTLNEVQDAIVQAKQLGLRSVKILGYREPFDNRGIYEFIDFLSEQSVIPVIFTSAYTLGENKGSRNLQAAFDFLASRNVSLMVKLHTLDKTKEDEIVRRKGYANKRDKYLLALLKDGRFNAQTPTRLGIENVLASQDVDELVTLYEYFRIGRNVFIDIDPPIPVGRTSTREEAERAGLLSQEQLEALCLRIYRVNQKAGIPFEGVSPYFGAHPVQSAAKWVIYHSLGQGLSLLWRTRRIR